jgi:hypothetical protein
LARQGQRGAVVTLICDDGSRYADTVFDAAWLAQQGLAWEANEVAVDAALDDPVHGAALRGRVRHAQASRGGGPRPD